MNTPFCGYTLLREIRRGGMGIVWLAEDGAGQRVAVKVLLEKFRHNAEVRSRFEMEPGHQLAHAHVPHVIQVDECNGLPYFAMEYVEGESLEDKLSAPPHLLAWADLHPILNQIATALDHIHAQGLIHRDVKPDNVLIRERDSKAYLIDFGIAKKAGRMALTGTDHEPFGTHAYMAPEQCQKPVRSLPASDIYALAVTAFQSLSGALPFQAATDDEFKRMHLQAAPPDICRVNPSISKSASAVLQRALAKDPQQRFGSASEFVESLHQAMQAVAAPAHARSKLFVALACLFTLAALGLGLAAAFLSGVIKLPDAPVQSAIALTSLPAVTAEAIAATLAPTTVNISSTSAAQPDAAPTIIPTLASQVTDVPPQPTSVLTPTTNATPSPTRNATPGISSVLPAQVVSISAGGQRWRQPAGWPSAEVCRVLKKANANGAAGVYFDFSLQIKNTSGKPMNLGTAELFLNRNHFPFSCIVEGNPQQVPAPASSGALPRITIGIWIDRMAVNDEISLRFSGLPNKRFCARLSGFSGSNAVFTPVYGC